jgi:hypothetical protein
MSKIINANTSNKLDLREDSREKIINDLQRNTDVQINIYRFKFSTDFMEKMYEFSKIHQYDERKVFKESWELWIKENEDSMNNEFRRLDELRYSGDILDKMFKSARYYFRKKSTTKPEPRERRIYVSCHKDTLDSMDNHILKGINSDTYKPSDGFTDFCIQHTDLLKDEIKRLLQANMTDTEEIREKIKKTYKNRYFMIIKK